jgi:predicted metalloprotease with PDZ domain
MKIKWYRCSHALLASSALIAFSALFTSAASSAATVRYHVSLAHPERHLFKVVMTVPQEPPSAASPLHVAIAAWDALYEIKDFASRVRDVRATGVLTLPNSSPRQIPLPIPKIDKQTWSVTLPSPLPNGGRISELRIEYQIFWDENSPFSSQLNSHHAFINPAEVLFYLPDRRADDVRVEYDDVPATWNVAQELPSAPGGRATGEAAAFAAPSFDALADAPAELSRFDEFRFDEGAAHIRVVVDAEKWPRPQLEDALRRIVRNDTAMMGETPFPEYLFFFHFGAFPLQGGMEHMNCTSIAGPSVDGSIAYAAHEFFHLWNVKRIRPQTLEPVERSHELLTRALWFAEGVTSTYASYAMVRTGLWSRHQFYYDLASQFSELDSRPARHFQSAEEASLDTWFGVNELYTEPPFSISYYNKGQLLGVMLDLAIRDATGNSKSLDDVLRTMNDRFAHRGRFYNDSADIEAVVEEVSGKDFHDFFARYVAGTDEIPANQFLNLAGLQLAAGVTSRAGLGFWNVPSADGSQSATEIDPGSPADAAGIRADDTLLTLNGQPFPENLMHWLREHSPGETVRVLVRRAGTEMEITFPLEEQSDRNYKIDELPEASLEQIKIREGVLHGKTD